MAVEGVDVINALPNAVVTLILLLLYNHYILLLYNIPIATCLYKTVVILSRALKNDDGKFVYLLFFSHWKCATT